MGKLKLKYDSSQVDRSKASVEPPQPGVYSARIDSVKFEKKNNDHPDRLVFTLKQTSKDGDGKGLNYTYWDYVNMDVDWKIDQYLQAALGVDTEKKKTGTFDPDDMVGKAVRVRAKADSYGGEYRAKLASVLPPADADEEDDDDEDEDDDVDFEDDADDEDGDDEDEDGDDDDDEEDDDDEDEDDDDSDDDDDDDEDDEDEDDEEDDEDDDEDEDDEPEPEPAPVKKSKKSAPAPAPEPVAKKSSKSSAKAAPAKAEAPAKKSKTVKYEDMDDEALNELLKKRKLTTKGSRTAKVARLREWDADPFS